LLAALALIVVPRIADEEPPPPPTVMVYAVPALTATAVFVVT
jgi:hypothetical protein